MKKVLFLLGWFWSVAAIATEGAGTIEELLVCNGNYLGDEVDTGWSRLGLFKLSDGKWFGTYLDYIASNGAKTDYDDTSIYPTVLYAAASGKTVNIKATYRVHTVCGVTAAFMWNKAGDFVRVSQ